MVLRIRSTPARLATSMGSTSLHSITNLSRPCGSCFLFSRQTAQCRILYLSIPSRFSKADKLDCLCFGLNQGEDQVSEERCISHGVGFNCEWISTVPAKLVFVFQASNWRIKVNGASYNLVLVLINNQPIWFSNMKQQIQHYPDHFPWEDLHFNELKFYSTKTKITRKKLLIHSH